MRWSVPAVAALVLLAACDPELSFDPSSGGGNYDCSSYVGQVHLEIQQVAPTSALVYQPGSLFPPMVVLAAGDTVHWRARAKVVRTAANTWACLGPFTYADTTGVYLAWTSDPDSIVGVNAAGHVVARAAGIGSVTVEARSAAASATVQIQVE